MADKKARMFNRIDEPNMSDTTLLVSVEDLINMAIGPIDGNTVDFKIIQTILHILARQMRLLEQKVVLEVGPLPPPTKLKPPKAKGTSTSESTSRSAKGKSGKKKGAIDDIKEEDGRGSGEDGSKDKAKGKGTDDGAGRGGSDDDGRGRDGDAGGKDADKTGKAGDKSGKGSEKGDKDVGNAGKDGKGAEKGKGADAYKGKGGKRKDQADKEDGEKDKDSEKKDKEAAEREREKENRRGGIGVREVTSQTKEELLVDRRHRSIEVVTQSQFALLQAAVDALRDMTLPPPPPTLPENEKLRSDLAAGSATLTDAMQAMQVAARVQAAEQAIGRLGGLLTALAGAGALRPEARGEATFDDDNDDNEFAPYSRPSTASRKSVVIQLTKGAGGQVSRRQSLASTASAGARASVASRASVGAPLVTQTEMSDAIMNMRQEIMQHMQAMANRAQASADSAANVAKSVAEKLDVALRLNSRISTLHSLVDDYAAQLAGFDAGLTTQMMSFQEQMSLMRNDMSAGLAQLDNANNNAETAAVMELTERYQLLVTDLEHTLLAHQALTTFQQQLSLDFRSLYECVEMLREQKADRDEVLDGLRDKADNDRLAGLLREEEFQRARIELELRMELCHEKFRKQDLVWVMAIKDLTQVLQTKAELMDLLKTRDETTGQLQEIHDMIKKLALVLGEPKAAMLTRALAHGAVCGACLVPALMDPEDATSGKPPALPAVRGAPVGAEEPCVPEWKPPQLPELRLHTCLRWVGGSHTLLPAHGREPARAPPPPPLTTRKYVGVGLDGRLYMMEAEMQPCVECNPPPPTPPPLASPAPAERGAGDRACACDDLAATEDQQRMAYVEPPVPT